MKKIKHLVVGMGEVGTALCEVLGGVGIDKGDLVPECDYLHICFPYSKSFKEAVREYVRVSGAQVCIIHSTVPVGVSRELGCHHSPIRGVHPHLAEGVRTFTKFVGVLGEVGGKEAKKIKKELSGYIADVQMVEGPENTEALKLWDTTQYGVMILLEKAIWWYCKRRGLDFGVVYRLANETYNDGYVTLGREEVVRPSLRHKEGKIGGHCVIPNAKLLGGPVGWLVRVVNWVL